MSNSDNPNYDILSRIASTPINSKCDIAITPKGKINLTLADLIAEQKLHVNDSDALADTYGSILELCRMNNLFSTKLGPSESFPKGDYRLKLDCEIYLTCYRVIYKYDSRDGEKIPENLIQVPTVWSGHVMVDDIVYSVEYVINPILMKYIPSEAIRGLTDGNEISIYIPATIWRVANAEGNLIYNKYYYKHGIPKNGPYHTKICMTFVANQENLAFGDKSDKSFATLFTEHNEIYLRNNQSEKYEVIEEQLERQPEDINLSDAKKSDDHIETPTENIIEHYKSDKEIEVDIFVDYDKSRNISEVLNKYDDLSSDDTCSTKYYPVTFRIKNQACPSSVTIKSISHNDGRPLENISSLNEYHNIDNVDENIQTIYSHLILDDNKTAHKGWMVKFPKYIPGDMLNKMLDEIDGVSPCIMKVKAPVVFMHLHHDYGKAYDQIAYRPFETDTDISKCVYDNLRLSLHIGNNWNVS